MALFLRHLLPENSRQYREEVSRRISWGHWFALFNIVVALLIASRYGFNADWPNTLFGKIYFFVSLLGHFSFVIFAFYLLLLFPLSFLIKNNRTFRGISVIVATLGMTGLLLDTEVFKRFYLHLSPLVWDLLVNPDEAELSRQWQLLFVPMPLILLAEMLYSRWCWQKLRSFNRQKWVKYVALVFVSCFIATHLLYAWADFTFYRPITAQKANYPLSYPMTARSFLEKHHLINRANLDQHLESGGRADSFYLNYPKRSLKYTENASNINVLFVNLSGLTNEMLDKSVPLSEIAQKSRRFMQHYSGGDSASGGIVSLFYSLSGRYTDAILNERTPSVLISSLQKRQYQFGLFSHNGFAEPLYSRALFAGFTLPQAKNNQQAINQWQQWLINRSQSPLFSYLDLSAQESSEQLDQQITQIWSNLVQQGLLHNTLVVITADMTNVPDTINSFATERIQVPMLIYWQGQAGRYSPLSSHLDIAPTLLTQFLGLTSPLNDYAQGIDLSHLNQRRWLLASNYKRNVAILPNGEQFHIDHKGEFEHYDENGEKQSHNRPPLALFLQLLQQSNQFIEK